MSCKSPSTQALTDAAFVAAYFAARMGWIDTPGGAEWQSRVKAAGDERTYQKMMREAFAAALQDVVPPVIAP